MYFVRGFRSCRNVVYNREDSWVVLMKVSLDKFDFKVVFRPNFALSHGLCKDGPKFLKTKSELRSS